MIEDSYISERLSDYDSKIFLLYHRRNGQKASNLVEKVKNEIADCGLVARCERIFRVYEDCY